MTLGIIFRPVPVQSTCMFQTGSTKTFDIIFDDCNVIDWFSRLQIENIVSFHIPIILYTLNTGICKVEAEIALSRRLRIILDFYSLEILSYILFIISKIIPF